MRRIAVSTAAMLIVASAFMHVSAVGATPANSEDAASRLRIRGERQRANADYVKREADCRQRFVVASCLSEAAASRRTQLERLQEEEAAINERQRAGRADVATQRVADKKAAMLAAAQEKELARKAAADKSASAATPAGTRAPPHAASDVAGSASRPDVEGESATLQKPRKPPTPARNQPTTSHIPDAAAKAKAKTEFDRRQQEAEKHRQEVEARNAASAAKKKPGKPLPMPDSP
ncbi:MAG: hypothetical protein JWQ11_198 [Rhizobacter sp.]|nr:hypothetical protein [Rhizobacter sp.]